MARKCGDCPLSVLPGKDLLKKLGIKENHLAYCCEAGVFVDIEDTPEDWGCVDEYDPWQR